jgi:hypothetical protein
MVAASPAAALAALHAAGDDLEALTEAVEGATFLDALPGEDRQKLRGEWQPRRPLLRPPPSRSRAPTHAPRLPAAARTRLRRLAKEAAAGGGAGGAPAREYDPAEFEALSQGYEKLSWRMVSKPGGTVVRPDDFYR